MTYGQYGTLRSYRAYWKIFCMGNADYVLGEADQNETKNDRQ